VIVPSSCVYLLKEDIDHGLVYFRTAAIGRLSTLLFWQSMSPILAGSTPACYGAGNQPYALLSSAQAFEQRLMELVRCLYLRRMPEFGKHVGRHTHCARGR
jgi:hypothetical protein